jgi:hydrogenase/urease accessory protein HupE
MTEIFPFASGVLVGVLVALRPRIPVAVAALLAVILGTLATIVSGEFRLSWAYLYFDIPFVALTAVGTTVLARSWFRRQRQIP